MAKRRDKAAQIHYRIDGATPPRLLAIVEIGARTQQFYADDARQVPFILGDAILELAATAGHRFRCAEPTFGPGVVEWMASH